MSFGAADLFMGQVLKREGVRQNEDPFFLFWETSEVCDAENSRFNASV
jgi:hypothetical protein